MLTNDASVTVDDRSPKKRSNVSNANMRRSSAMRWSGLSAVPPRLRGDSNPIVEPSIEELPREPQSPAHLQHEHEVAAEDSAQDEQPGQDRESNEERPERLEVLVLDRLEEQAFHSLYCTVRYTSANVSATTLSSRMRACQRSSDDQYGVQAPTRAARTASFRDSSGHARCTEAMPRAQRPKRRSAAGCPSARRSKKRQASAHSFISCSR